MPRYIVSESQTVLAIREVEADSEDEAIELFDQGEGEPVGKDGDVVNCVFLGVEEVPEEDDDEEEEAEDEATPPK
jgi:hypothetical protein